MRLGPLGLALRAVRHHRLRAWISSIAIAAAVATIHIHLALTVRPGERVAALIDRFESHYLVAFDSFGATLESASLEAKKAELAHSGVTARYEFLCTYFTLEPDPLPLLLCGLPRERPRELDALFALAGGREPRPGALEAMVESGAAMRWMIVSGDRMQVFRKQAPLQVTGIFTRAGQAPTADVYAPLEAVQRLREREGYVSFALLDLRAGVAPADAAGPVAAALPDVRVLPASTVAARLRAGLEPMRVAGAALAGVIAALCGLTAMLSLLSSVNERMAGFAVQRVLGTRPAALLAQVLVEGSAIGVWGAAKGLAIGEGMLILFGARIHPALGAASTWRELAIPFGIGLIAAVAGAFIPAIRACRAQPQQLMLA